MLSGNKLTLDKILTTSTNMKFIRITYIYECCFVKTSCFQTTQSANVNEKRDRRRRTDNETEASDTRITFKT
ncbi:hypothetical protein HanRHA438_Chr16g0760071 [Helianthus annuus]|nr:hypothetical protein HanRHA438_Chr16g0760071 [Helianthus annuus]